jgi:hypothetical protein
MDSSKTINCPQCGHPVAASDHFCPKCYARIEPPSLWRKLLSLFQPAAKSKAHILNIGKTVTIKTTDKDGTQHEYHSLDEVPPEMRAAIEKLESEALKESLSSSTTDGSSSRMIVQKTVSVFKVKDAQGNERIYHSLNELPPEIREAYQRAQTRTD